MRGLVMIVMTLLCMSVFAQSESNDQRPCKPWPDFAQAQFAGTIGFVSVGAGYGFFNDNFRVALLYGYVPKRFTGSTAVHQFTLKPTLRLVRFQPIEPLLISPYIGATATLEPNRHSILVLPDRYPDNYYGTTAFHFSGVGGLNVAMPVNVGIVKGLEAYGELVVLDTMLGYRWQNDNVGLNRMFSAAFGLVGTF